MKWYRLLLLAYPKPFRDRFGQDLEELFADLYRTRAMRASPSRRTVFWVRITLDTLRHALSERLPSAQPLPLRVHRVRGPSAMSLWIEDVQHAFRALRHQKALSAVILVTLMLAIGANTAIFTVINAVLLRPLPYADPDRVVMLSMLTPNGEERLLSLPDFADFRDRLQTIRGLSVVGTQTANLTGLAEPDRLRAGFVSADFFDTLGVRAIVGRTFFAGEDQRGARKTAILEHEALPVAECGDFCDCDCAHDGRSDDARTQRAASDLAGRP